MPILKMTFSTKHFENAKAVFLTLPEATKAIVISYKFGDHIIAVETANWEHHFRFNTAFGPRLVDSDVRWKRVNLMTAHAYKGLEVIEHVEPYVQLVGRCKRQDAVVWPEIPDGTCTIPLSYLENTKWK